jgi:hypothetical protein
MVRQSKELMHDEHPCFRKLGAKEHIEFRPSTYSLTRENCGSKAQPSRTCAAWSLFMEGWKEALANTHDVRAFHFEIH